MKIDSATIKSIVAMPLTLLCGLALTYVSVAAGRTARLADVGDSGDPVDSVYCDECLSVSELAGEKGDCSVAPAGGTGLGLALAALALARRRRAR